MTSPHAATVDGQTPIVAAVPAGPLDPSTLDGFVYLGRVRRRRSDARDACARTTSQALDEGETGSTSMSPVMGAPAGRRKDVPVGAPGTRPVCLVQLGQRE